MFGVYVYPAKGQSQTQQTNDESVCYKSARSKTGVDPANLPPATAAPATVRQGGAVRGAAGGAAGGAAIGAIAGNAGQGAAIGAVPAPSRDEDAETRLTTPSNITRKLTPRRSGRQSMNNFRRAFAACLESKGYKVK